MRKSKFSEEQIIGITRDGDAGLGMTELCRGHGISPSTFYNRKAKYSGMDTSQLRELKALQSENEKITRLPAQTMLDKQCMQAIIGSSRRTVPSPAANNATPCGDADTSMRRVASYP